VTARAGIFEGLNGVTETRVGEVAAAIQSEGSRPSARIILSPPLEAVVAATDTPIDVAHDRQCTALLPALPMASDFWPCPHGASCASSIESYTLTPTQQARPKCRTVEPTA
jgi:hypothetical protein